MFFEREYLFEDIAEAHGGQVKDEEQLGRLIYTAANGTRINIDTGHGRISLGSGRPSTLLSTTSASTTVSVWADRTVTIDVNLKPLPICVLCFLDAINLPCV
jgi:hypothetical protein